MLYLTRQDIEERRARGWEEGNLYDPPSPGRIAQSKELIAQTSFAFRGVTLGRGIGLFEGQAIDDYSTPEERARQRSRDEKVSWPRIPSEHLNACYSSLSFFDAEGMRFHLPAFLICDLKGDYKSLEIEFSLTRLGSYNEEQFNLFTTAQKEAVAAYLEFLAEDIDGEYSRDDIARALQGFWRA